MTFGARFQYGAFEIEFLEPRRRDGVAGAAGSLEPYLMLGAGYTRQGGAESQRASPCAGFNVRLGLGADYYFVA